LKHRLSQVAASTVAMTFNSGSIVASTAVTSALGAAYWWLAAHQFPISSVGLAGAVISAMTLLGFVGTIGFGTALVPRLADDKGDGSRQRAALLVTALLAVAIVGLVLGGLWQLATSRLHEGLGLPGTGMLTILLFAAGVSLTALTLVLDQALIGLLRGDLLFLRGAVFAVAKLGALFAAGIFLTDRSASAIYATWCVGQTVSLLVLSALVVGMRGRAALALPRLRLLRGLRVTALAHHLFNLGLAAPNWILPLIVTVLLSATANAYFYLAWTVAGFVFVGPIALSMVLYSVAAKPSQPLARPLRLSLLLSLGWGVLASAACFLLGSMVLRLFGPNYALGSQTVLLLLGLSVFPQVVKLHYVALVRIWNRMGTGIVFCLAGGVLELGLVTFGVRRGGVSGAAAGWLVAACLQAVVVLPTVLRAARARPERSPRPDQAEPGAPVSAPPGAAAKRPLRVAMVTPRYHPFTGGIETHVHEVATRLAARDVEVTVLTADSTRRLPAWEKREGVVVRRRRAWPWLGDLQYAPGLRAAVAEGPWDVVHVQGVHTLVAPMVMAAARRRGLPYVVTFHTGGHSSRLRNAIRPLQWRLLRPLLTQARGLVAVCEYEAELFGKSLGLSRDRFRVIRNGFEMPGRRRSFRGDPPGPPVILSIGRLERYKGHHRVIAAMETVVEAHPLAELYVVGSGPDEERLRRRAAASSAAARIRFVSFPPERREELAELIGRAHLVALLSEYEAHPVSVMEAIGLGRRVLVAQNSGLHELAEQGLAGEVPLSSSDQEIGDAMLDLLRRPAPKSAARLQNWQTCVDQLAALYEGLRRRPEVCPQ
jgi:glycosyltransferase involved in cell wall biosynthesis/O-antigen/teichoic acid export membrane protein